MFPHVGKVIVHDQLHSSTCMPGLIDLPKFLFSFFFLCLFAISGITRVSFVPLALLIFILHHGFGHTLTIESPLGHTNILLFSIQFNRLNIWNKMSLFSTRVFYVCLYYTFTMVNNKKIACPKGLSILNRP